MKEVVNRFLSVENHADTNALVCLFFSFSKEKGALLANVYTYIQNIHVLQEKKHMH